MTSPLLRLFAVCWWLVVIGSGGLAIFCTGAVLKHYYSYPADPTGNDLRGVMIFLGWSLPFAIMTVTRWIITGHWRFGPHW